MSWMNWLELGRQNDALRVAFPILEKKDKALGVRTILATQWEDQVNSRKISDLIQANAHQADGNHDRSPKPIQLVTFCYAVPGFSRV